MRTDTRNEKYGEAAIGKTNGDVEHLAPEKELSPMAAKGNGVQNWFATNGVTIVLAIIAFASTFTYVQTTVSYQRERIDDLKTEIEKMKNDRTLENQRMVDYMASTQNILREVNGKLDGMNSKK